MATPTNINIQNTDCVEGAKQLEESSIDLLICDPPFGINEASFDKHYKRDVSGVCQGYQEAPKNIPYEEWCCDWLMEAKRVLKNNGTLYVFSGWTHLNDVLNAIKKVGFYEINHIIWKYNFGVNTKKKFVSSHYHILMLCKSNSPNFNTYCRFGHDETLENGNKALYNDLEDVFIINKEYQQAKKGVVKNQNKLPDALLEKLIMYSSYPNDTIGDFFMGNFTTAYNGLKLGRKVIGFEINKEIYDYHLPKLSEIEYGVKLNEIKQPKITLPANQGKRISDEERKEICEEYEKLIKTHNVTQTKSILQEKFKRGKFSITNIIDKFKKSKLDDN
jgi:site-specific DNA-methyltransferase (adenine-specific)